MTMVYEITGNPDGTVTVDARRHGRASDTETVFYRKDVEYISGYLTACAAMDLEASVVTDPEGALDEEDNRNELTHMLYEYLKDNPAEAPA